MLCLKKFILLVFVFMSFVYAITTITSTAYAFAATTSHLTFAESEPARGNRVFWMAWLMLISGALMSLGGLDPLKTASNIIAFPMILICASIALSLIIRLKEDGFFKRDPIFVISRHTYSYRDGTNQKKSVKE